MTGTTTFASLSPAKKRLVALMQRLNFGCIEQLNVRNGEPVFDPPPQVFREFRPGGDNSSRPESRLKDFELKIEVIELLDQLDQIGNTTIQLIEVKHGLPFKALVEEVVA